MSIHLPTWCSRGSLACAAASGAYAGRPDAPGSRGVPHRQQSAVVRVFAEPAERGHVQLQPGGCGDVQLQPRDGEGTQDVAVREQEHTAVDGLAQVDDLEGPLIDLGR